MIFRWHSRRCPIIMFRNNVRPPCSIWIIFSSSLYEKLLTKKNLLCIVFQYTTFCFQTTAADNLASLPFPQVIWGRGGYTIIIIILVGLTIMCLCNTWNDTFETASSNALCTTVAGAYIHNIMSAGRCATEVTILLLP